MRLGGRRGRGAGHAGRAQFPGAAERLRRRSHRGHRVLRLRPAVHRRTGPAPGTAARAPGVAGAVDGRKRRRPSAVQ
ncbi:hypothetical protein G6F50_016941 [Rhizopus delemar]|uniref:Uncharacterized protein n=1 Tax=Rhizopus delemar TaxID=936053 RepID=A0A9P7C199_9FUNG|nr:hypothetical protein G6F50_016941 [Rhizopus delemar]